ncbi:MAG: hypothetical protein ACRDWW_00880 [Acidimicrobiales bacterium]
MQPSLSLSLPSTSGDPGVDTTTIRRPRAAGHPDPAGAGHAAHRRPAAFLRGA